MLLFLNYLLNQQVKSYETIVGESVMERTMKPAVFLDRDGTINIEKGYLYLAVDFEFVPGAPEAIQLLNKAGFLVVVVTNQSGIARGYYTEDDVENLHRHVDRKLESAGAHIDVWLYCPHHPSGRGSYSLPCTCRKPLPGMLLQAAARYKIDLEKSFMVGDKLADIEAGLAAGCSTMLVRTGYGTGEEQRVGAGTLVCNDLLSAAHTLVRLSNPI
jgi:D-glycero-D-manno-heptose 1,7-bisphosphate phosphatase